MSDSARAITDGRGVEVGEECPGQRLVAPGWLFEGIEPLRAFEQFKRPIGLTRFPQFVSPPLWRRCEASEPRAPAVLHQNSDEAVVVTSAGGDAGAGKELERVIAAQRQRKGTAEAPVALQVMVVRAVEGRGTASEILPVECGPDAGAEIVDDVGLAG